MAASAPLTLGGFLARFAFAVLVVGDELAVYAGEYQRTGFQGGLNW